MREREKKEERERRMKKERECYERETSKFVVERD